MKLLTYEIDKKELVGVLNREETFVYPLSAADMDYRTMKDVISEISPSEMELLEHISGLPPYEVANAAPLEEIRLLAPIPVPEQDIICLGINYMEHAKESARFKKEAFSKPVQAVYFSKRVNRATAPLEGIPAHQDMTSQLDYEAELAVILKKDAKNVSEKDVQDYIFGYTIMNDVSARDVQTGHGQWYFGKSLEGFTPLGPWIVTADSIDFPPRLAIRSKVNGELRQNSNTELFIHGIAEVICELSRGMTLKAGTIIATGTPAGVGMGFDPPRFMKPGDVVECIIEDIGTLKNTIIE